MERFSAHPGSRPTHPRWRRHRAGVDALSVGRELGVRCLCWTATRQPKNCWTMLWPIPLTSRPRDDRHTQRDLALPSVSTPTSAATRACWARSSRSSPPPTHLGTSTAGARSERIDGNAHDAFPVSAVWTGAPEGTPWNVPTAAIENAAEQVRRLPPRRLPPPPRREPGSRSNPTTNLVTFNPDPSRRRRVQQLPDGRELSGGAHHGLDPGRRRSSWPSSSGTSSVRRDSPRSRFSGPLRPRPAEVTAGLKVASELDAEAVDHVVVGVRVGNGSSGPSHEHAGGHEPDATGLSSASTW